MRRIVCTVLGLLIFLCYSVRSEEIQLKDGTKVSGKIVAVNGDVFQVKTAYGDIQIPRTQIITIGFPENAPAETKSADIPVVDESLEGTAYTNRTAKFKAVVPAGWKISPEMRAQSKDVIAALASPDETLFFMVTVEPFEGTAATYQVLLETQYQSNFKDYEKLSQSEVQIDGKKVTRFVWHGKNKDAEGAALKSSVYIIPDNGRMVRLFFLTLEPLFVDGVSAFDKIANSYHSTSSGN